MYQMLIGCLQMVVTLGRYDVQCAMNMIEQRGIHQGVLRIFGYLNNHTGDKLYSDTRPILYGGIYPKEEYQKECYPEAEDYIDVNTPKEKV